MMSEWFVYTYLQVNTMYDLTASRIWLTPRIGGPAHVMPDESDRGRN